MGIFKKIAMVTGLCAVVFLLCLAGFAYLPHFVQNIIQHTVARENLPITLKVRDVGLWGSDFSEIVVGTEKPFARIAALRLDYSPATLRQKKLKRISLVGLELDLVFQDGKLIVPWGEPPASPDPATVPKHSKDYLSYLDRLGEIRVEHALIRISAGLRVYTIPCSVNLHRNSARPQLIAITAELLLREQPLSITAELDLATMTLQTEMTVDSLELLRFADLLTIVPGLSASGRLALQGTARLALEPLSLIAAEVSGKLSQAVLALGEMRLTNPRQPDEQPFQFNLRVDQEKGHLSATALALAGLFAAEVGGLDLNLARTADGFSASGELAAHIPAQKIGGGLAIAPLDLVTSVQGSIAKEGSWQFKAAAVKKPELAMVRADLALAARVSDYLLTASGQGEQSSFVYQANLAALKVTGDNFTVRLPKLVANGKTVNGRSKFVLPFANLLFTGKAGDLTAQGGGRLVFAWPYRPPPESSKIRIEAIRLADLALGSLSLDLQQEPLGFKLTGRHQSALVANLCFDLTGQATLSPAGTEAELQLRNGCEKVFKGLDLGRFAPQLSGFAGDGELDLAGALTYKAGRFSGRLDSRLENIRLVSRAKEFSLEGGALAVDLAELPRLKTGPQQKFSFKALRFGKITASNGLVEFQIESPESIFIEKSQLEWSDGHIYTQALRFSPKIKDYDMIFYCDRLNFAKLLEQLGAATAEGQGRVNGRVPVRIIDGRFYLENGFLYSTPGEGGKIRLRKTEALTAGIPQDTPQFAQIDLAREALKDFAYNWTKLEINSESEEDLLLHLQIDGKPVNPLPFIYSQESGGFVRVDGSNPGSRFQGINLDVNFRLPLNRVLYYGDSIKSLIE
jgi:hypothetical protein